MITHPALRRELAHQRRRAAARPHIRILRLPLSIARALGIAAPDGFPWHEHRSLAEVEAGECSSD